VILLYKKGNEKDPENYKESVLIVFNRLFVKIIHNKLQETYSSTLFKHIISEDQNGFSPSRRYMDGLFIVQQVTEKKTKGEEEMYIIFIDLKKAYISKNRMWQILQKYNIDNRLIGIIKKLYDIKAYIKNQLICFSKGLRQGYGCIRCCALSTWKEC